MRPPLLPLVPAATPKLPCLPFVLLEDQQSPSPAAAIGREHPRPRPPEHTCGFRSEPRRPRLLARPTALTATSRTTAAPCFFLLLEEMPLASSTSATRPAFCSSSSPEFPTSSRLPHLFSVHSFLSPSHRTPSVSSVTEPSPERLLVCRHLQPTPAKTLSTPRTAQDFCTACVCHPSPSNTSAAVLLPSASASAAPSRADLLHLVPALDLEPATPAGPPPRPVRPLPPEGHGASLPTLALAVVRPRRSATGSGRPPSTSAGSTLSHHLASPEIPQVHRRLAMSRAKPARHRPLLLSCEHMRTRPAPSPARPTRAR
ncbi:wiskott-Aldrich syndrome protein family member 1-like [Triticum aestivum]|uniref:wiskott-Aldrich syndrome protein family member 1-like n=1 Tax=Triticum aestivum TaxID=4565 RepID=UPI00098AE647|nr:wiskott-Aldrich syndrome protein family member 1-like [Aegilops tauschii subsp. strangulata]XP_044328105.1 wiskott-Aldrich syndrome protein family member 1-like [Triticum aestivum]